MNKEPIPIEAWNVVYDKYYKLITYATLRCAGYLPDFKSRRRDITADFIAHSITDIIPGYCKKNGLTVGQLTPEHAGSKLFGQYFKTCIWHYAGRYAKKLKKNYKEQHPIEISNLLDIENPDNSYSQIAAPTDNSVEVYDFYNTFLRYCDPDERVLLEELDDEAYHFASNGFLNIAKISRQLNLSNHDATKMVDRLKKDVIAFIGSRK